MLIVLLLFIAFLAAVLLALSDQEINQAGTGIVFVLADKLFPRPWGYVAIIAVMLSSIGTLETSILQFTRTLYAQGRDGSLHPRYARIHPVWRTPWVATLTIAVLGLSFLQLSAHFPSVNTIIQDSVNAIGFQVAFYYSLASLACCWHYRHRAVGRLRDALVLQFWPLLSAAFLIFIAIYSIPTFDLTTRIVGIGGIVLGAVPLLLNRWRMRRLNIM